MDKLKQFKGITLISLVITIIILLILAGVTIAQLTGNGLFENAKLARQKYKNAQDKEQSILDEYEKLLNGDKLPENTPDTEAGTLVALKDGWGTQTVKYFKTTDGTEVTGLDTVSTVYAVSVGNGETVPVPNGFYYVGGTLSSGVVISDNESDKNKYAGQADVPSGIEAIKDDSGNITGINRILKGNQFIWIPCSSETYKKYDWGTTYRSNIYSTDVTASELTQVQKYGGFYVGRYESGLDEDITVSTGAMVNASSTEYNISGIPRIQAGLEPWNFIDYTNSKANAESLYSDSNSVNSGLLTGTMWDTMMYFMGDNSYTSSKLTSADWGNCAYTTPEITLGKTVKGYYSSSSGWIMDTFTTAPWKSGVNKTAGAANVGTNSVGYVWTTGSSEESKLKNLYDVAGNTFEWIEETAITNNEASTVLSSHHVCRGSGLLYDIPMCFRTNYTNKNNVLAIGFRVALYMK